MKRVIQASLNRNPYSLEEDAYARLEVYLAESAAALAANPDREEILLDLEQAVADQCRRRLPPQATVITLAELGPALEEIGPVSVPTSEEGRTKEKIAIETGPVLQQISQGAWVSGVCLGLARYLRAEVTLIRVIALALLFFTGGSAALVYAVFAALLPFAEIDPQGPPPGKIPAKLREWIESIRRRILRAVQ
jgi:phage shock protein PspC (stress-responsive transcriptional regulator)